MSNKIEGEGTHSQVACMLFALLAYPNEADWLENGKARIFARALGDLVLVSQIKGIGLARVREIYNLPNYTRPQKDKHIKILKAGFSRMQARWGVFRVLELANRPNERYRKILKNGKTLIIGRAVNAAIMEVISGANFPKWQQPFVRNATNRNSYDWDEVFSSINVQRRAMKDSIPVIHLAAVTANLNPNCLIGRKFNSPISWIDWLAISLCESEKWIEDAINEANSIKTNANKPISDRILYQRQNFKKTPLNPIDIKNYNKAMNGKLSLDDVKSVETKGKIEPYCGLLQGLSKANLIDFDVKISPIVTK